MSATDSSKVNTAELLDLDFRDHVIPPAASFEATLVLNYGWGSYEAQCHTDQLCQFAAAAYKEFGGGEGKLPFAVKPEDVEAFVGNFDNKEDFGVWGFEEEIIGLALRYLSGEGEDYDTFHEIVKSI